MVLRKKTPLGTLKASYKPTDDYPGFYVDVIRAGDRIAQPVCNVEYDSDKKCVQVVVYGNASTDDPTAVIEVPVADTIPSKEDTER